MKSRRNTSESESEPSGNKLRASRAPQDSGLSGVSVEMNAWTRRNGSSQGQYSSSNNGNSGYPQPRTPDTAMAPTGPLPIVPPQASYQPAYQRPAPQSPRHSPRHHHQSSQRASSSSSQDGRNSRRGSRGNGSTRPTPIPTIGVNGEEMYFPLSPAPPKRKSDTGTRLTHGSDSDVLPPDDRNYPVPVFNPAQFQLPPQQEPLPQLQPHRQQQQPSSTHLRIIHASATGPPSIYWSDDGASGIDSTGGGNGAETATIATSTNPSAFTFYREGTPPPGGRDLSDEDDDDDDAIQNEKFARHRSQFREIGLALSNTKRGSKQQKANASAPRDAAASGGGGGGGGDRRPGEVDDNDDDDEDGMNREERDLAEFEFVNGRYVPPGLRDGRMPGRKPVSENHDDASDSYYERGRGGRQFWYVAGIVVFVIIAVAVGVGVGAGIGLAKKNNRQISSSTAANATTSASAAVSASVAAATVLSATTSPAASSSAPSSSSTSSSTSTATSLTDCPAANGTTYKVSGSSTTFLRLCGIDYSGTGAAVDLSHLPATSMDDCMNNCAGTSGCTACGWGPVNSSTTSSGVGSSGFEESGKDFQCYMKSTLGNVKTAVKADSDWCFAILQ